jgi:glyceraldehyde 3-phosphate dehydrogenase
MAGEIGRGAQSGAGRGFGFAHGGEITAAKKRAEEVNALFAAAAQGPLAGILGYEERPLVSVDYARDTRSAIVDALSTMVTDGTLLKIYAWYDNEMGYACRMVDLACHMNDVGI